MAVFSFLRTDPEGDDSDDSDVKCGYCRKPFPVMENLVVQDQYGWWKRDTGQTDATASIPSPAAHTDSPAGIAGEPPEQEVPRPEEERQDTQSPHPSDLEPAGKLSRADSRIYSEDSDDNSHVQPRSRLFQESNVDDVPLSGPFESTPPDSLRSKIFQPPEEGVTETESSAPISQESTRDSSADRSWPELQITDSPFESRFVNSPNESRDPPSPTPHEPKGTAFPGSGKAAPVVQEDLDSYIKRYEESNRRSVKSDPASNSPDEGESVEPARRKEWVEERPLHVGSGQSEPESQNPSRNGTGTISMSGVDEYIADRPNPLVGFMWFLIVLGFVFLLGLQIRTSFVDQFAQNGQLRPYLSLFCKIASCELPPRLDRHRLFHIYSGVNLHPSYPGAVTITIKFANKAEFAQPYPDLRLTLNDKAGRVIGRRTFSPETYLKDRPPELIESGEQVTVDFNLAHLHEEVVGYIVDIVHES